jgi:hypothetical protein
MEAQNFISSAISAVKNLQAIIQDVTTKLTKDQINKLIPKTTDILGIISQMAICLASNNAKKEIIETEKNKMFINNYSVILTPKNCSENADKLHKRIHETIKIRKLGINVVGIQKISKNRLIIKCNKKEDATKLRDYLDKELEDVETKEIGKKKPTLIFRNIHNDYVKEDFLDDMFLQNTEMDILNYKREIENSVCIKKIAINKYNHTSNYIVEMDSDIRRILIKKNKVNIGYQKILVEDANPVVQCFHCLRFGHTAGRCLLKEEGASCSYCAGSHSFRDCKAKEDKPKCKNCVQNNLKYKLTFPTEHRANDKNKCKFYTKMFHLASEKIEY